MQRTGILLVRMKTNDKKNIGRWFEVMTAGTTDKVALYWYAELSVLTHRSWCGDYTHTRMHTNSIHATLTQTHAPMHARNTHTYTRSHAHTQHSHVHTHPHTHTTLTRMHACTHQYTTRPTHTLMLKCSTYMCMRTHQALTDTYTTK